MILLEKLLEKTIKEKASDLHLTVGVSPIIRKNGELTHLEAEKISPLETENCAKELLGDLYGEYIKKGEIDTSYSVPGLGRFRVSIFKQRGSTAISIRVVTLKIPTLKDLKMPEVIKDLTYKKKGLVLVTGSTGAGKSTTLAAMINEINANKASHIITLEDPIEFLHKHNKSIINQREIGRDTLNYKNALKAALREDPDIILIGELRDLDTISIALTAAETGHLVFSTLHTIGAAKTIDRIVNVYPPYQQQEVRMQLASVIEGIVCQQLIPKTNGKGRIAALEIMTGTNAIRNMIREGKSYQIESSIQTGSKYGMKTMDISLAELYKQGLISYDAALTYAMDKELIMKIINI
ncbi:type IV pilus twitching motility protein PilT [Clostridium oceanicum]|uniref:Type IV pilus twitching motility protein PilT n=1 Tax=Clostridium oceanicum TaxID=1543 RepID=A0ABP3UKW3_9CLOT